MRKIVFLISVFCLGVQPLYTQIILNNDTTVCSMQIINLNALSSDVSSMQADDSHDSIRDIGFTFNFYGIDYDSVYVSSNGLLGFNVSSITSSSNTYIPSTSNPDNIIALIWDDLPPCVIGVVKSPV